MSLDNAVIRRNRGLNQVGISKFRPLSFQEGPKANIALLHLSDQIVMKPAWSFPSLNMGVGGEQVKLSPDDDRPFLEPIPRKAKRKSLPELDSSSSAPAERPANIGTSSKKAAATTNEIREKSSTFPERRASIESRLSKSNPSSRPQAPQKPVRLTKSSSNLSPIEASPDLGSQEETVNEKKISNERRLSCPKPLIAAKPSLLSNSASVKPPISPKPTNVSLSQALALESSKENQNPNKSAEDIVETKAEVIPTIPKRSSSRDVLESIRNRLKADIEHRSPSASPENRSKSIPIKESPKKHHDQNVSPRHSPRRQGGHSRQLSDPKRYPFAISENVIMEEHENGNDPSSHSRQNGDDDKNHPLFEMNVAVYHEDREYFPLSSDNHSFSESEASPRSISSNFSSSPIETPPRSPLNVQDDFTEDLTANRASLEVERYPSKRFSPAAHLPNLNLSGATTAPSLSYLVANSGKQMIEKVISSPNLSENTFNNDCIRKDLCSDNHKSSSKAPENVSSLDSKRPKSIISTDDSRRSSMTSLTSMESSKSSSSRLSRPEHMQLRRANMNVYGQTKHDLSFQVGAVLFELRPRNKQGLCYGLTEDGRQGWYPEEAVETFSDQTQTDIDDDMSSNTSDPVPIHNVPDKLTSNSRASSNLSLSSTETTSIVSSSSRHSRREHMNLRRAVMNVYGQNEQDLSFEEGAILFELRPRNKHGLCHGLTEDGREGWYPYEAVEMISDVL